MATLIITHLNDKIDPYTLAAEVQKILGHSNIQTTIDHYLRPVALDPKEVLSIFSSIDDGAA
jgi:integrase